MAYATCQWEAVTQLSFPPQSLKLGAEKAQEPEHQQCPAFPKQTLLYQLNSVSVCMCVYRVHEYMRVYGCAGCMYNVCRR